MLWSESTVTDVARTQWLVRWGAIPADVGLFCSSCFRVCFCQWGNCSTTLHPFCCWNFVDTSLGRWNRANRLGFRCLRKQGFHRAVLWIRNLKHFTVGFVRVTKNWSTKYLHVCFTRSVKGLLVFPYHLKYLTLQGLQDLLIVYHFTNSPHWMMPINFPFILKVSDTLICNPWFISWMWSQYL